MENVEKLDLKKFGYSAALDVVGTEFLREKSSVLFQNDDAMKYLNACDDMQLTHIYWNLTASSVKLWDTIEEAECDFCNKVGKLESYWDQHNEDLTHRCVDCHAKFEKVRLWFNEEWKKVHKSEESSDQGPAKFSFAAFRLAN